MNIVVRNPGCLEVRKILRQAQQQVAKRSKSNKITAFLCNLQQSFSGMLSGGRKVTEDSAIKGLWLAEKKLRVNPDNIAAHKQLGVSAEVLGLWSTATFAYEEIYRIDQSKVDNLKSLMNAYIKMGKNEEAVRIGKLALEANLADSEIQSLHRKASVDQTIEKGNWEKSENFREKLKDEEESLRLEEASRAKTGEAGIRALIESGLEMIAEEPGNLNNYRDLVANYRKLGEFENAIEWISKARETEAGMSDVNLERLSINIQREKMALAQTEQEAILAEDSENVAAKATLEKLKAEEHAYHQEMITSLVQRYPNEFSYRYELGTLFFKEGKIDAAIKELQFALRSPKVRIDALILLGKAYKDKKFYDLAIDQFETAKSEIPGFSDQKKDVLYELGTCFELQGDMDKAIAEYKAIYGADIEYRDVAQKIDEFYSRKNTKS